jgi:hypothetical protein
LLRALSRTPFSSAACGEPRKPFVVATVSPPSPTGEALVFTLSGAEAFRPPSSYTVVLSFLWFFLFFLAGVLAEVVMAEPIDIVLGKLRGVRKQSDYYMAFCPVHEAGPDHRKPSLQVSERPNGSVGIHCHAGCSTADVLRAHDLRWSDLYRDPPPPGWKPRS